MSSETHVRRLSKASPAPLTAQKLKAAQRGLQDLQATCVFNALKQQQKEDFLGVNNKTKAMHLETIPRPPGWQGNWHSSPGWANSCGERTTPAAPLHSLQLMCLEQQLKPPANPAYKIPPHSCHSLLLGTLLPLTLASCYSPWLPLKSLFICLKANEQNTTAYFLHCLKIFHGDVSCRDSFLQHMTKFSWRLAQKGSRLRQNLAERKSFAQNWAIERGYESSSNSHVAEHTGICGGRFRALATLIPLDQWETLQESCGAAPDFVLLTTQNSDLDQGKMRSY